MKWIATLDFIHPDLEGRHKQGLVYDYEETEIVKKLAYVGYFKPFQMPEVTENTEINEKELKEKIETKELKINRKTKKKDA